MTIPKYHEIMLPLLKHISDNKEYSLRQVIDDLSNIFNLTKDEKAELLPSGQAIFVNRVGWARTYLKKAGLISATKRGYFRITDRGKNVLHKEPKTIDANFLKQFEEFRKFVSYKKEISVENEKGEIEANSTPEELLANAYQHLKNELADELLNQLKSVSPDQFERIVVDVLVGMGYGGSRSDAAKAVGKSGDEGIDGIINEDRLGLDVIYIQAKKWEGTIGSPEIQKFAGALQGQRSKKGIFITTSEFSKAALDFVNRIENKIVLIDGRKLVEYMIDHNIGVSSSAIYEVKKIDNDYFNDI